jgi:serine/threonine protein kinase
MREQPYAAPADVYPYGIILWELIARAHPFDEYKFDWTSDLEKAIRTTGLRPTIPADCPEDYAEFIRVCWDDDPQKRPSFKKILDVILPPLIDKYAPQIKPYIQRVIDAEKDMVKAKTAAREAQGEKEPFKGTFITSVVVPKARIKFAVLVDQDIWCTTEEGGILVFGADVRVPHSRYDLNNLADRSFCTSRAVNSWTDSILRLSVAEK